MQVILDDKEFDVDIEDNSDGYKYIVMLEKTSDLDEFFCKKYYRFDFETIVNFKNETFTCIFRQNYSGLYILTGYR
jgi:hypothetical protein